ncbi:MAG: hypothetical protein ABGF52_04445 [Candidatus Asgardarchaeum sp.]
MKTNTENILGVFIIAIMTLGFAYSVYYSYVNNWWTFTWPSWSWKPHDSYRVEYLYEYLNYTEEFENLSSSSLSIRATKGSIFIYWEEFESKICKIIMKIPKNEMANYSINYKLDQNNTHLELIIISDIPSVELIFNPKYIYNLTYISAETETGSISISTPGPYKHVSIGELRVSSSAGGFEGELKDASIDQMIVDLDMGSIDMYADNATIKSTMTLITNMGSITMELLNSQLPKKISISTNMGSISLKLNNVCCDNSSNVHIDTDMGSISFQMLLNPNIPGRIKASTDAGNLSYTIDENFEVVNSQRNFVELKTSDFSEGNGIDVTLISNMGSIDITAERLG